MPGCRIVLKSDQAGVIFKETGRIVLIESSVGIATNMPFDSERLASASLVDVIENSRVAGISAEVLIVPVGENANSRDICTR